MDPLQAVHAIIVNTIHIAVFVLCVSGIEGKTWPSSTITAEAGHYPYIHCQITDVMLVPEQEHGVFYTKNSIDINTCLITKNIWHFGVSSNLSTSKCSKKFDVGHVILVFYFHGYSNYFHVHWDTAIPLYKALYHMNKVQKDSKVAVLPSVESKRLQEINWKTDAFSGNYRYKYWNIITETITGNHTYLPLDDNLLLSGQTICFEQLHFGTVSWKTDEKNIIQSYMRHVMMQQDIKVDPLTVDRIGIISRKNRRKILNEEELVNAVADLASTDIIDFDGLSYKQQVELMQNYTVVAGINGAGLMNCLYLPPTSVCIQLVPYDAEGSLNYKEYGKFLKMRGPYIEWHNTHIDLHVGHLNKHASDTKVHVAEFVELIKEALGLARNARQQMVNSKTGDNGRMLHDDL